MNSLEINDKKANLKKRAYELIETAKKEIRDFTTAEQDEYNTIVDNINNLNTELRELENKLNSENKPNKTIKQMEFRLIQAINAIANNKNLDATANAVIAKGNEEMRKAGLSFNGQIQLPTEERAVITVETKLTSILEPLRAKNVLVAAGAKFLTGLVGDVQVPIMNGGSVTWEGETAPAQDGAGSFDHIKLTPKRLTAYVDVSKQFLVQDSLDAERLIREDIVNAINSKLESTILGAAEGTSTMPQGIFYTTETVPTISNFADVADLESDIEDANINGECKYIMSNKAKAKFRVMPKSTKSTQLVYENGGIDGTDVLNTSHVSGLGVAYGDWSNLAIGQWGAIDLTVDPFSQATNGKVRLVVNAFFDAKVLRDGAIVIANAASE